MLQMQVAAGSEAAADTDDDSDMVHHRLLPLLSLLLPLLSLPLLQPLSEHVDFDARSTIAPELIFVSV